MTAPAERTPVAYHTTHIYADALQTATTVRTRMSAEGMTTTVDGGPLHDSTEITSMHVNPSALREQHHKWVWRVLNADMTRPEWFRSAAKRLSASPA